MLTQVVADTNVIAYLLLGTEPFLYEVEPMWRSVKRVLAPAHWQAELANVFWTNLRAGLISFERAQERLTLAKALPITTTVISSLWIRALARAADSGVAVYDTLFVELAERRGCPLVTFDQAILRAFPDIAARPRDLL
ncbi:MAG: PIN domain-containing protein [Acidobacteria bacterium]|nr:MAG: PIN domain-containing protein [Acidobacteriota bacterium]